MNDQTQKFIEFRKSHPKGKILYLRPENECILVNGKWEKKIEIIMDAFGVKEWLGAMRNELGIKEESGIRGLNEFMKDKSTRLRYWELRDRMAQMAKGALER